MTFWEHLFRLLPHKPVPALAALYWHLTGRKLRARNRLRVASADLDFPYTVWIEQRERTVERVDEFREAMAKWARKPSFAVLLHSSGSYTPDRLQRSIASLDRQIYPIREQTQASAASVDGALDGLTADFVVPLRIGDLLSETALFRFAEAMQSKPGSKIFFGDHDHLDEQGRRRRPWFKPRWNEEMFLAQDYLSAAVAIDGGLARTVASTAVSLDALLLAATALVGEDIVHVPHILCHVATAPESRQDRLEAVRQHVQPLGATCTPGPFGTTKVQWPLPSGLPLVSIIVPTRDKLELLQPCIQGLLERTDYANFEVVIIDNESVEQRTRAYLAEVVRDPRVRVLPFPGGFRFGAMNNHAAGQARGDFICLLNNDTEIIDADWLTQLMRYAVRPEVGAAGAKLLYDDGSIQHAGVIVGIGGAAGHAHRSLPDDHPGYFRQAHVAQFVSAVTAACLVVDKRKFIAVGGLDEAELPVAFNDVDLCLKLQKAGWRNVYVPHAVLLHHESKSRGSDTLRRNIDRFRREERVLQERWGTRNYSDPLLNPNLDPATETFVIRL